MYKIVNGIEEVNWYNPPELAPSLNTNGLASAIRGNSQRLWREQFRTSIQGSYGTLVNRITQVWNKLPDDILRASQSIVLKQK